MKKINFYSEIAYVAGLLLLPLGIVFAEKANLGLSTVAAPAYLLYLKISPAFPFYTFGMSQFMLQVVTLLVMIVILRKFRISFLLSFATSFLFNVVLDFYMMVLPIAAPKDIFVRIIFFIIGELLSALGVAFFFRTYIPAETYDIFVKYLADHFKIKISKFKTGFDCAFALVGLILSFSFYGLWHFEGIEIGTLFLAIFNGTIIGRFGNILDKNFSFVDRFPLKKYFS